MVSGCGRSDGTRGTRVAPHWSAGSRQARKRAMGHLSLRTAKL